MSNKDNTPKPVDAELFISGSRGRIRNLKPYDPSDGGNGETNESPHTDTQAQSQENEQSPDLREQSPKETAPKEDNRRRKGKGIDYEDFFFKEAQVKTRSGKVVYIRREYHERILKILRIVGQNEISLFSYLDNVLKHHFDQFQDDMARAYNEKNADDFFNK